MTGDKQLDSSGGNPDLFREGENCAAVVKAGRVALLVDAADYFRAFMHAARLAEREIMILGWDFDSRIVLDPEAPGGGQTLGDFLNALARARRALRIRVLDWDYPMIYGTDREFPPIYGLAWKPHRHISFRYDDTHPVGASHHQKVIVIDNRLAFTGGIDLAARRWDSSQHAPGDPRRVFNGEPYPPTHDVMVAVDGDAAAALGDLARERWRRATGQTLKPRTHAHDVWPRELPIDLANVRLAIARTAPPAGTEAGIREIEQLYLDMIGRARDYIYIENQYFTSEKIGAALRERLQDEDCPEIVVVSRLLSHGWLEEVTMQVLRIRNVRMLRDADRHGRFHVYCPHIENLAEGTCIDLHSKLMIVDDEWLRIGSSNISNRSMGMDTECDVVIEARGEQRVSAGIRAFRDRLIAEHLGAEPEATAAHLEQSGSMAATIAELGSKERWLCKLDTPELPESALSAASIADPEQPISIDRFVQSFSPDVGPAERSGLRILAVAVLATALLALAWRYTPLSEAVRPANALELAAKIGDYWWAPVALVLAYTPASLVMFPRWLLTLMAVAVWGPWSAFVYAQTGVLLAALAGYFAGELLSRDTVRHMAGPRMNRISAMLQDRGLVAVTLVRLVPVAPFMVVNAVMGAMRIRVHHFLFGTMLGMLPGMLATTVLGDQINAALAAPGRVNTWLIALIALVLLGLAAFGNWWLRRARRAPAAAPRQPSRS